MGRRIRWSLVLALLVMLGFTACSKGDDSGTGNTNYPAGKAPTVNGKYLVKVGSTNIQYNAEGQVSKVGNMDYSYEPKRIVISPNDQIYYLTNGLITELRYTFMTSMEENAMTVDVVEKYEYDIFGQLVKITGRSWDYTEDVPPGVINLYWQDGNISKITYTAGGWDDKIVTFSYTSHANTIPFTSMNFGYDVNSYLEWQGYFGKRCKNLPARVLTTRPQNTTPSTESSTFDYTISDGMVTKIKETYYNRDMPASYTNSYVYNLEWW